MKIFTEYGRVSVPHKYYNSSVKEADVEFCATFATPELTKLAYSMITASMETVSIEGIRFLWTHAEIQLGTILIRGKIHGPDTKTAPLLQRKLFRALRW